MHAFKSEVKMVATHATKSTDNYHLCYYFHLVPLSRPYRSRTYGSYLFPPEFLLPWSSRSRSRGFDESDLADVKSSCVRLPVFAACAACCCSERAFWYSACRPKHRTQSTHTKPRREKCMNVRPHPAQCSTQRRRTDAVREPLLAHVVRVPDGRGKVGCALVDVDELDELRVQVRVPERAVRHQAVVEVLRARRVALQRVELRELRLCAPHAPPW